MLCQEQKVKRSHFIVIDAESKYILYVFLKKTLQLDQCVSILYFFFGSDRSPRSYKSLSGIYVCVCVYYTGCPKKNALLSLKAYNSGSEGAIGTSRDSFGILRL